MRMIIALIIIISLIASVITFVIAENTITTIWTIVSCGVTVFLMLIAGPLRPLFKKFACEIGWHCYSSQRTQIGFDGMSNHVKCIWRGYEGMEDSQGNLF